MKKDKGDGGTHNSELVKRGKLLNREITIAERGGAVVSTAPPLGTNIANITAFIFKMII